jgi:hypothetical protein
MDLDDKPISEDASVVDLAGLTELGVDDGDDSFAPVSKGGSLIALVGE